MITLLLHMKDEYLQNDAGLDTFIQNAILDPQTTRNVIAGITPELWQEWHDNGGEIYPRPADNHPLSFIIGKLLLRGDDLRLTAENEDKIDRELAGLREMHRSLEGNPEKQAEISRTMRLERLRLIVNELEIIK